MTKISFENIAPDGEVAEIPDGYRDFIWTNYFRAIDDGAALAPGFIEAIHSGEAVGFNAFARPIGFKSADRADDFDFNSAFFTAVFTNNLEVKVLGLDDGKRVATKLFLLDSEQEFVAFGRKFDNVDEVRIQAKGGTDADLNDGHPPTPVFAVDDLFIDF